MFSIALLGWATGLTFWTGRRRSVFARSLSGCRKRGRRLRHSVVLLLHSGGSGSPASWLVHCCSSGSSIHSDSATCSDCFFDWSGSAQSQLDPSVTDCALARSGSSSLGSSAKAGEHGCSDSSNRLSAVVAISICRTHPASLAASSCPSILL